MLLLEYKRHIHGIKAWSLPDFALKSHKTTNLDSITPLPKQTLSPDKSPKLNTENLKLKQTKLASRRRLQNKIPNPKLIELELTPHAKKFIKSLLSPIAVISYILQESSVGLNKMLAASTSFLMFSLLNCFTSASFGSYEVKLPMLSICLFGSIIGAKKMVKALKKIILSIPTGITVCSQNITCENCSIFDFICGIDKRPRSFITRLLNRY